MIHKSKLKNKYVRFRDKDGKDRVGKVVRIDGNTLTVRNANGEKQRIKDGDVHLHAIKDRSGRLTKSIQVTVKIFGRQLPKKGIEEIDWNSKPKEQKTKRKKSEPKQKHKPVKQLSDQKEKKEEPIKTIKSSRQISLFGNTGEG